MEARITSTTSSAAPLLPKVDTEVHKSGDNVGLQASVETLAVSGWSYGFVRSQPRVVTFRLHGFRDNGLAPDTDFELDMSLRFELRWDWQQFLYPAIKTLVARLMHVKVTAHGLGSQSVADGVRSGGLQVLVAAGPIAPGGSYDGRVQFVQAAVDKFLDGV